LIARQRDTRALRSDALKRSEASQKEGNCDQQESKTRSDHGSNLARKAVLRCTFASIKKVPNMTSTTPHYTLAYQGQLRTAMQHLQSNSQVITDAPVDNRGKGEAFSPTDLVSAALASCVMTIMAIKAGDMGHETIDMEARVWKTMASNPRRIARIQVELDLHIPEVTDQQKIILERTTKACPVARSLHPDTQKEVVFNWR
jgi:uncharacterized OsmC-like protein